jgi:hypothetical protein
MSRARAAKAEPGMIGVAAPLPVREPEPMPWGEERRAEPRVRTNTPARLFYGSGFTFWIDCIVKDRSKSGAKVQAPALFNLPNELVLLDFEQGFAFEAQLRWRKAELAGIWLREGHDLRAPTPAAFEEIKKAWEQLGPALGYR